MVALCQTDYALVFDSISRGSWDGLYLQSILRVLEDNRIKKCAFVVCKGRLGKFYYSLWSM